MAEVIKYESALPQLLTQLMGQKSSSSTSKTTTGTANVDPLMAAFDKAMQQGNFSNPDMQQLIASIFQEGAKNVPALTSQYANATGSRVSGNSGLQLALGDLNRQMSVAGAEAVLKHQQAGVATATQAAGGVAQATRSETSNTAVGEKKGANPKSTTGMGLAGLLLNQADKRGFLDAFKSGKAGAGTGGLFNVGTGAEQFSPIMDYQGNVASGGALQGDPYFGGDMISDSPVSFASSGADGAMDFGGDIGGGLLHDFGASFGAGELFSPEMDLGADFSYDFASDFDVGGGFEEFVNFEEFFANGGMPRSRPMRGYADGGVVGTPTLRNKNNMGNRPSPVATPALNYRMMEDGPVTVNGPGMGAAGGASVGGGQGLSSQALTDVMTRRAAKNEMGKQQQLSAEMTSDRGAGMAVDTPSVVGTVAENNAAMMGMLSAIAAPALGVPSAVASAVMGLMGIQTSPMTAPAVATQAAIAAITNAVSGGSAASGDSGVTADGVATATGVAGANSGGLGGMGVTMGLDAAFAPGDATSSDSAVGDTADGDSGIGVAEGSGAAAAGDAGASSGVGGADGAGFKNGGRVRGAGTSTSDSIRVAAKEPGGSPVNYSDGEFVIPAEVIRMTGSAPWEQLLASFNIPR